MQMNTYEIFSIRTHPEWRITAARWFQDKWEIPLEEYLTSIDESINGSGLFRSGILRLKGNG